MPAPEHSASKVVPFGSYLLDEMIAEGGMARVFRGRLRGVGGFEKPLVVKQVKPDLARDPRFVSMFVQEANTLVRLSHPHIVSVYELGIVDGVYFLAMEYVDGATLSDILKDGPLTAAQTAHLAAQACDALAYAHDRFQLVHRDVTPRNILVDASGNLRLVDFGIAAPADQENALFGSPGYMAPEQYRGDATQGRTDLFALGAVLYQCLTGEPAFWRKDAKESRRLVLEADGPSLPTDVARPIATLVHGMLERDPTRRPESAAGCARALRAFLATERPEGVAEELGERAQRASPVRGDAAVVTVTSRKGGEVRTLATSAILREARDSDAPAAAEPSTPTGTERIERQPERQPEEAPSRLEHADDVPRTAPIGPEPSPQAEPTAMPGTAPIDDASATATPPRRPASDAARGRSARGVGTGLAVAVGATVVALLLSKQEPAEQTTRPRETPTVSPVVVPPTVTPEVRPRDPEAAPPSMVEAPPERPRASGGQLTVTALPWATVELDARPIGNTPRRQLRVPAGEHTLVLSNQALGRSIRVPISVPPGGEVRVHANLSTDPPRFQVQ